MKRTPGYLLQNIAGADYLQPYGQMIADHRRGVAINETGCRVWELLEQELSREELHREYQKDFPAGEIEQSEMIRDLDQFLDMLIALKILQDDDRPQTAGIPSAYISIAGLTLSFEGPMELIDRSYLKDFCVAPQSHVDQRVRVQWGSPVPRTNGTILLRGPELIVCEREEDYLLMYPSFHCINEVSLSKDGSEVVVYCWPPLDEDLIYQFFHALRLAFLYLAQKHDMWAIHSASLLYREKAWLFSASAGTGKSTHVDLWRKLYEVAPLNGDLNLLALEEGRPVIHGIPWCGTSEIFDKRTIPLGGITLLKRGDRDRVEELSPDQQALLVLQRFISPLWTTEQLDACTEFAQRLTERISVCRLRCTKEVSAAKEMKAWIDKS